MIGVFSLLALFVGYRVYDGFFAGATSIPPPPVIVEQARPQIANQIANQTANQNANQNGSREVTAPPGNVAVRVGTTSGQLDPTLHEEAMHVTESLVYSGTGRNIFATGAAQQPAPQVAVLKPIAPPRPLPVVYTPPPPPPTCPPTCPPINLKFFGTSTSATGVRKAFLLQGDDVFLASAGDVVERKYRVVSISPTSIVVEDMPNVNKQTLPLVIN